MGEPREGLGTMADPAELAAALVAIGLLKRSFTAAELAAEAERADGRELHRLELAHALAGAADMQILMAAGAAADAGADPARITRASSFAYTGANVELVDQGEEAAQVMLLRVQAQRLANHLMVLVADSQAGRADAPLIAYPAMLVATALESLLQAAQAEGTERAERFRQVAETLRGGAEVAEELADRAEAYAARFEGS